MIFLAIIFVSSVLIDQCSYTSAAATFLSGSNGVPPLEPQQEFLNFKDALNDGIKVKPIHRDSFFECFNERGHVTGVAQNATHFLVLCYFFATQSSQVLIYDHATYELVGRTNFNFAHSYVPVDFKMCPELPYAFVTTHKGQQRSIIWKVDLNNHEAKPFITNREYKARFSFTPDCSLMVMEEHGITIYNKRGYKTKTISLPTEYTEGLYYGLQLDGNRYMVAYQTVGRRQSDIVLVDSTGNVLTRYKSIEKNDDNKADLFGPVYLEPLDNDYVIVSDMGDVNNGMVLLVSTDLSYGRVMAGGQLGTIAWPYSLSYDEDSGLLLVVVSNVDHSSVNAFSLDY